MATLLQITNRVLRRLREDEVSDLSEAYPALIAEMVSDIVDELSEATVWSSNDHEVNVSVVAGTTTYALSGTSVKSTLLWAPSGRPQAWMFDDASDPDAEPMIYLDPYEYHEKFQVDREMENDTPLWFTIEKDSANDALEIKLWPVPSTTKYIRIRFNTPQTELDPTTDAATEIELPQRLVFLGALWLALNERGEEIGEPGNMIEQRFINAKAAAIEIEVEGRERAGYFDWVRN